MYTQQKCSQYTVRRKYYFLWRHLKTKNWEIQNSDWNWATNSNNERGQGLQGSLCCSVNVPLENYLHNSRYSSTRYRLNVRKAQANDREFLFRCFISLFSVRRGYSNSIRCSFLWISASPIAVSFPRRGKNRIPRCLNFDTRSYCAIVEIQRRSN